MSKMYSIITAFVVLLFLVACGGSQKEDKGKLNDKKVELEKLKKQSEELDKKIAALQKEIGETDSNANVRVKLVTAETLQQQGFKHYIDLQGRIATENTFYVTPRGPGGQVKAVYVKNGDNVRKGQLLLKLDDGGLNQQIEQAKIQLSYVEDIYKRRKNLWDQKIGTEVELVTAKNNVDNQKKIIDQLEEQLSYTNVYAENPGVAERVDIKVGETFSSMTAAQRGIEIISPTNLKVAIDVPENYLSRVSKGTPIVIEVPDINKTFNSTVNLVSTSIDPNSRTFKAEAKLPQATNLKPNLMAVVKLQDYAATNTIVIPMRTVQTDQNGKYVYVLGQEKGKDVAIKKQVTVGDVYGEQIEVKAGLAAGDKLITQGYQDLYEGQLVTTVAK